MVKIGKREKNWLLAGGGGIVFVFVFINMVLKPLVDKVQQIQKKLKITEIEVKEALQVQARKDKILEEYNSYQGYLKQEDYSDQEIVGNFLKELEKIAQKSNISVISLSPSEPTEKESYKVYNADLRAEGDIEEVLNFFSAIQESKLLIKIEKFSVSPKDEKAAELKLDAKISMFMP